MKPKYFKKLFFLILFFPVVLFSLNSCGANSGNPRIENNKSNNNGNQILEKQYIPKIIKIYPHQTDSYTQGLYYLNGQLYESVGQYGSSALLKVDIITGEILKSVSLLPIYFAEGITKFGNKIYQLTWQNQKGFIYDVTSFDKIGEFTFPGEGWGITNDSNSIIISDGSNFLNFYNPSSFELLKTLMVVRKDNTPVYNLNELELINGKIFANVYLTNEIVIINTETGIVEGSIDISSLALELDYPEKAEVANGIAFNPETNHYYFTGKYWSNLFEVELVEK
jgi:glutamine cyclotransferase